MKIRYKYSDEVQKQLDILYGAIESIKKEIEEKINESNIISKEIFEEYQIEYIERSEPYRKKIEKMLKISTATKF